MIDFQFREYLYWDHRVRESCAMPGLKLTPEAKGLMKTTIRKLQYDFDLDSLSFLELLDHLEEFRVDRAGIRTFLKKYDLHKFCHSDFKLLRDYETVLSDSIEVSSVFFSVFYSFGSVDSRTKTQPARTRSHKEVQQLMSKIEVL